MQKVDLWDIVLEEIKGTIESKREGIHDAIEVIKRVVQNFFLGEEIIWPSHGAKAVARNALEELDSLKPFDEGNKIMIPCRSYAYAKLASLRSLKTIVGESAPQLKNETFFSILEKKMSDLLGLLDETGTNVMDLAEFELKKHGGEIQVKEEKIGKAVTAVQEELVRLQAQQGLFSEEEISSISQELLNVLPLHEDDRVWVPTRKSCEALTLVFIKISGDHFNAGVKLGQMLVKLLESLPSGD